MILKILKYIWLLPQNLLALLLIGILKGEKQDQYKDCDLYSVVSQKFSGISLGKYILLNEYYYLNKVVLITTTKHEYGHYIQGLIFGWLYLIVIGIPSLSRNLLARVNNKMRVNYYKGYPENWADKLGGVERK
jgi:hypothetical protein